MSDFVCGALFSDMSDVKEVKAKEKAFPAKFDLSKNLYPIINQGSRGICCSVSMTDTIKYLEKFKKVDFGLKRDFYYNKRKDKSKDGMTVKEAMQIAKAAGHISSYGKLNDVDSVKFALLTQGPVIICTNVYNYESNFWKKSGSSIGGHATVLVGWNEKGFVLKNSWGTSFGNRGYAIFPYEDFKYIRELWTIFY